MMRRLYLLILLYPLLSGCKKTDTNIPDYSTFFARFNGYPASISTLTPPATGTALYSATNTPISPTQSNGSYTSALADKTLGIVVSITKATLLFSGNGAPSSSEFQGFFTVGSVAWLGSTNSNGIAIGYIDKNGDAWNSALGDQTGSEFYISYSELSGSDMEIEAQFTCKLYDADNNIIYLTGGTFNGLFQPQ